MNLPIHIPRHSPKHGYQLPHKMLGSHQQYILKERRKEYKHNALFSQLGKCGQS